MFPVYTGMNRQKPTALKTLLDVPRIYGDEPKMRRRGKTHLTCSPYIRG